MKMTIVSVFVLLLSACTYVQGDYEVDGIKKPNLVQLEIKVLTDTAIKELGLTENDSVLSVNPNGLVSLYMPEGKMVREVELPMVVQEISNSINAGFIFFKKNPNCIMYQDSRGNRLLLPIPPC